MADLKKELNDYLLSNKNEQKITIPSVVVTKTNIRGWFERNTDETRRDSGWIKTIWTECCPAMTRTQRLLSFVAFFFIGLLCFCVSIIYIPVLILKARKFALLYSVGSLCFLISFCFLWGPTNYIKSLFKAEKRCFSVVYFSSLTGTLYCALHLQSTPLTIVCVILQLIAMLSFLISHLPGGTSGLMFFTRIFKTSVNSSLPV